MWKRKMFVGSFALKRSISTLPHLCERLKQTGKRRLELNSYSMSLWQFNCKTLSEVSLYWSSFYRVNVTFLT